MDDDLNNEAAQAVLLASWYIREHCKGIGSVCDTALEWLSPSGSDWFRKIAEKARSDKGFRRFYDNLSGDDQSRLGEHLTHLKEKYADLLRAQRQGATVSRTVDSLINKIAIHAEDNFAGNCSAMDACQHMMRILRSVDAYRGINIEGRWQRYSEDYGAVMSSIWDNVFMWSGSVLTGKFMPANFVDSWRHVGLSCWRSALEGESHEGAIMLAAESGKAAMDLIDGGCMELLEAELAARLPFARRILQDTMVPDRYGSIDRSRSIAELSRLIESAGRDSIGKMYYNAAIIPGVEEVLILYITTRCCDYGRDVDHAPFEKADGMGFEAAVRASVESSGWRPFMTSATGDQGVDIIACHGECSVAIQCKNYSCPVGNSAVQEVYAGARVYGCGAAAVVALNGYTKGAKVAAAATGVFLLDFDGIREFLDAQK